MARRRNRRGSGGGRRRRNNRRTVVPFYKPRAKRSQGNPRPTMPIATYSITLRTEALSGTSANTLLMSNVIGMIYNSVNRTAPATAVDDFTFTIKGVRASCAQIFQGKFSFFDVRTNYCQNDYGTGSSRPNCGITYPIGMLAPFASNASGSTVLCAVELSPVITGMVIEFSVNVDVVWKSQSDDTAAFSSQISRLRDEWKYADLKRFLQLENGDISESVAYISLSERNSSPVKARSKGLLNSLRVKGKAMADIDYEG